MVTVKYARADVDKTSDINNTIKTFLDNNKKVFVIVPEQLSLQREFSIGSVFGNKVSVLSFARLCNEIFRKYGNCAKKTPDNVMISAAVYRAVLSVYDKLTYYKSVAFQSGFISKLVSVFSEFETNCMTEKAVFSLPEKEMTDSIKRKYTDLFTIYNEYLRLWNEEYKAPGTDIANASGIIELCDFFSGSAVIFDGFYGFTPSQYLMLTQILSQADALHFYFTTDLEDELFSTVNSEIEKIEKLCKKAKMPVNYEPVCDSLKFVSSSLSFIEKYGFSENDTQEKFENDGNVTVYAAKNFSEELNFIACKIKNDVLSKKYRYRDIAVMVPDTNSISTVAMTIFEKHGIPVYIDENRSLLSKPLMAFVLNALDVVTDGFEYESVFGLLKTGLTPICFDDISVLENYVRMWKIRGKNWSESDWTQSPFGIFGKENEQDSALLEKINDLKNSIYHPLCEFSEKIKKAKSTRNILYAIYQLLEDFSVRANLEKIADAFFEKGNRKLYDEYMRVYDIFIDMLDSIDEVFAGQYLSAVRFSDMISVLASQVKVSHRPSRVDEVVIANIGLVREEHLRCVYIPCMNDGIIPKPFSDSSLISEKDKRIFIKYGIPVSMDFITRSLREKFDLYVAITSPSEELVLSMSRFEITGEIKLPSEYIENIIKLTGLEYTEKENLPDDFYFVSLSSAGEIAQSAENEQVLQAIFELTGFSPISENKQPETLSDSIVEGMYSKHLRLSFSGIEEYINCPFKFFLDRGLRISKNEPVEFNPANMGTFIHAGLERLLGGDYDISDADEKQIKNIVNEISDEYYNTDLKNCKGRSRRFDYLFSRAKYALESAAIDITGEIQNSDFKPFDFEIDISQYVQPTRLENGYSLSLVGSIDRVDMLDTDEGKYVKVIDYKSGSQKFSLKKIYNGISMQLPIYAGAVRSKYKDVKFAAMYYLKVGLPKVETKDAKPMDEETYRKKISAYYTRDGIFCSDGDILSRLDKSQEYIGNIKKDSIVDSKQIERLVDYTQSKIKWVGESITKGDISISPIVDSGINSCEYCDFKDICRIDQKADCARKLEKLPDNFLKGEESI